jgi:S1 RNA binding domain protein
MPIEVGALCDGKVTKITAFGAFVALDGNKSGMIHISEISSNFVKDIRDHLSEGQDIRVKVIKIDENGRISLSLKQATEKKSQKSFHSEFETANQKNNSFEEMLSRFKASSDEKIYDLRQSATSKRGQQNKNRRRYNDD